MKYGGIAFPAALEQPITVVFDEFGDVIACGLKFGLPIILLGLCSGCIPVSSSM